MRGYNKNSSLLNIMGTILSAIIIVIILCLFTEDPYNRKNGFSRSFFPGSLAKLHALKIRKDNIVSTVGASDVHFYFQTHFPNEIFITDSSLSQGQLLKMPVNNLKTIASNFNLHVDSPHVYIYARNVPSVIIYDLNNKKINAYHIPCSIYTREAIISKSSLVIRGFDSNIPGSQIFMRTKLGADKALSKNNLNGKSNDAGISTDGLVHYDQKTNLLCYTYFYRNGILCMDTALNELFTISTIDTVKGFQIDIKGTLSKDKQTISYSNTSPLTFINVESCAANGKVFNASTLKADNEIKRNFLHNSVIDVYDLEKRKYIGSFYIPFYKGEKMRRFNISKNILIAIYPTYIVTYQLPGGMIK